MERISSSRVKQIIEIMWKNREGNKDVIQSIFLAAVCKHWSARNDGNNMFGRHRDDTKNFVYARFRNVFLLGEKWSQEELEALS